VRRPQRSFIVVSLIVAALIAVLGIRIFLWVKKPAEIVKREEVKRFSFSSASDLDELDEKALARKKTDYSIGVHEGKNCIKAVSEDSASSLYYKRRFSYKKRPFLSWDWKAEVFPSLKHKEALNKKAEFDFVAQVYVIFYNRFFLKAKCIQYVWTVETPVGTVCHSPYTKNVMLMVLESGPSDQWKHEQRDIRKDFRDLFGAELDKEIDAIAFMTDADSSSSRAVAYYSNIVIGYLGTPGGDKAETGEEAEKKTPVPGEVEVKEKHPEEMKDEGRETQDEGLRSSLQDKVETDLEVEKEVEKQEVEKQEVEKQEEVTTGI